jgi:hypothetical protein
VVEKLAWMQTQAIIIVLSSRIWDLKYFRRQVECNGIMLKMSFMRTITKI